jgi:hypothetical protein
MTHKRKWNVEKEHEIDQLPSEEELRKQKEDIEAYEASDLYHLELKTVKKKRPEEDFLTKLTAILKKYKRRASPYVWLLKDHIRVAYTPRSAADNRRILEFRVNPNDDVGNYIRRIEDVMVQLLEHKVDLFVLHVDDETGRILEGNMRPITRKVQNLSPIPGTMMGIRHRWQFDQASHQALFNRDMLHEQLVRTAPIILDGGKRSRRRRV